MQSKQIHQVCHSCATEMGWKGKTYPVGMWTGPCDVCGENKSLCANRDYDKPLADRIIMSELEAIIKIIGKDKNSTTV